MNNDIKKTVSLAEAVQFVQTHFSDICCGFLTFTVIGSLDDPRIPYIAIRCREHCLLEEKFRVHDVTVNRDGTIYATKLLGIDGETEFPTFTGR